MLTERDCRIIARSVSLLCLPDTPGLRRSIAEQVADELERSMLGFDRDRFLAACLPEDQEDWKALSERSDHGN